MTVATVAEFTLAPGALPLGAVFSALPDATVVFERVVQGPNGTSPYVWAIDTGGETVPARFSQPWGVRAVDCAGGKYLMRWSPERTRVLEAFLDTEAALLSAVGTADAWRFEVMAETRDAIAGFRRYCEDRGVSPTLVTLRGVRPPVVEPGLTEEQREALRQAYERGYFDSPRTATQGQVAAGLGISQQALASRLRRGTRRLVEQSLLGTVPVPPRRPVG